MKRSLMQYLLYLGLALKLAALIGAVIIAGPSFKTGPRAVSAQEKAPAAQPQAPAAKPQAPAAKPAPAGGPEPVATPDKPASYDPRLIQLLDGRREGLAQEEARLAREREELKKLREEVNQRIGELRKVQDVLEKLVQAERKQREEKVMQLVKLLTNMRAPAAAAVMAKLDDQMAVEIFSRMQSRAAGKVMAELEPEQAARIGVLLTQQKQARQAAQVAGQAAAQGAQPPAQPAQLAKP